MTRRMIQLRPLMAVGWLATGTRASMKSGYISPHIQACMPPMEMPSTNRRCFRPSASVTSRCCATTASA